MSPLIDHIAIIMDGNGRWAEKRSKQRFWGHVRGSMVVSEIVEAANDFGVKGLTLYAFSTENWSRPIGEVKLLFQLLKKYLDRETDRIVMNDIRFKLIGDVSALPEKTKNLVKSLEERTRENKGLKLNIAFSYGGKKEIVDAVNFYIAQNPGKCLIEEDIEKRLTTNDVGNVDLLIRTGGDHRISNFLLWQSSYAEFWFSKTLWPDFSREEFSKILTQFRKTNRRFGTLDTNITSIEDVKRKAWWNRSVILQDSERF
ncbi:MAG: polyprenyl diphosphate synthase [Bacteriovoracales bacterium]|nr:polyprenyl diphosphate synthase [Bacteriovoracales bacterium]